VADEDLKKGRRRPAALLAYFTMFPPGEGWCCGTPGADAPCERRRWSRCLRTAAGSLHEEGAAAGSLGEGRTSLGSVSERVDGGGVARRGADAVVKALTALCGLDGTALVTAM